jgi:hypothetical protein
VIAEELPGPTPRLGIIYNDVFSPFHQTSAPLPPDVWFFLCIFKQLSFAMSSPEKPVTALQASGCCRFRVFSGIEGNPIRQRCPIALDWDQQPGF